MLRLLNVEIDKEMGTCLYTSLLTDTGSFRHSSTTAVTHNIAGELINTGIEFSNIHRMIFENKKFEKIKFYGEVINNMTAEHNSKVCIMYISKNMLEKYAKVSQIHRMLLLLVLPLIPLKLRFL